MKKTSLKRVISLLLAVTLLISAFAVSTVSAAESDEASVEIVSKNVYYGETLKFMFAVKARGVASTDTVAVKLYSANGNEIETVSSYRTETVNGESCYVFTSAYGVPEQNIDTEIYAKAVVMNGSAVKAESALMGYSILEYLYERLTVSKDNGKVTEDQAALYAGLVEYAGLAEKVLTNKTEDERVANYSYIRVMNGTLNGEDGVIAKRGSVVSGFKHAIASPKYTVVWQIDKFDKSGNYIDSDILTDVELQTGGYTVTDYNVVISARENSITEEDVLAQISTFGNPSNFNSSGGTYTVRGCVRFSFPIKAGTTFSLKEEYRSTYKIAMNYTMNPEYKDTAKYVIHDLGWDADGVYTTEAKYDGLYPVVCFARKDNGKFTQDDIEALVTMLEVTGEKANLDTNRGKLTSAEL